MGKVNISGKLSNTALRANEYFRRSWQLKEISFEDLDSVYFRKRRLKSCIQRMLDAINGRTIEIRVLTTEYDNDFSEDSVHALVRNLMDSLDLYIRYKQSEGPYSPHDLLSLGVDGLNPKRTALFRSFLYLAIIHFMYTDADLSDLIDFAADTPVYRSYREFLSSYFKQMYLPQSRSNTVTRENGVYKIGDRVVELDLFELNAQSFSARRSSWLNAIRSTRTAYYGLSGEPRFDNRIMQFRYLTHASETDISQMLDDLAEQHISVPASWIEEYNALEESYREQDLYEADETSDWQTKLLETSIREFLHLQRYASSSEAFSDAIAGMIDVYTVRGGGMAICQQDSFYKIFDNLKKIERFALDHLSPFKKEAL